MELTFDILLLLAATGFLAALIDAIAGGGGLLTVPMLLSTGLPPHLALGTNKFQSSCGTAVAVWRYAQHGLIDWKKMRLAIAMSFIAAAFGTITVQFISSEILEKIVPVLVMMIAFYFLFAKKPEEEKVKPRLEMKPFSLTIVPAIGFYDGFFGPGTGSFFTASLVALKGFDLKRAAANTRVLNLASNVAALLMFIAGGKVVWIAGIVMAVFAMAGGYVGSKLGIKHGARLIRPVLVAVCVALCLKLLID